MWSDNMTDWLRGTSGISAKQFWWLEVGQKLDFASTAVVTLHFTAFAPKM
jgi:hypothetical protein